MVDALKIYLVYTDNGEFYDDYRQELRKVFNTHEKAVKWLISEGYEVISKDQGTFQKEEDHVYYYPFYIKATIRKRGLE